MHTALHDSTTAAVLQLILHSALAGRQEEAQPGTPHGGDLGLAQHGGAARFGHWYGMAWHQLDVNHSNSMVN